MNLREKIKAFNVLKMDKCRHTALCWVFEFVGIEPGGSFKGLESDEGVGILEVFLTGFWLNFLHWIYSFNEPFTCKFMRSTAGD